MRWLQATQINLRKIHLLVYALILVAFLLPLFHHRRSTTTTASTGVGSQQAWSGPLLLPDFELVPNEEIREVLLYHPDERKAREADGASKEKTKAKAEEKEDDIEKTDASSSVTGATPPRKRKSIWKRHGEVSKKYHVLLTSQSTDYLNWQSLVMYYHYRKQKESNMGRNDMGGFTRLVAAGVTADEISNDVPSVFVKEIDREKVRTTYKGYAVLNRPFSLKTFFELKKHEDIKEDFIYIGETDHIFMKAMPNFATVKTPIAYPFSYMTNMPENFLPMVQTVCPSIKSLSKVQPIGPSPAIIHKDMLKRIIPEWYRISIELKTHRAGYGDQLGWILEMYAFSISCACLGIEFKLLPKFQIEPVAQTQCTAADLKSHSIFHFTYPLEFNLDGKPMPSFEVGYWSLNKRNYGHSYPPKFLDPPPQGSHAGAFFLRNAWMEASKNQTRVWKQAPVTLGTIGWRPEILSDVELDKRGLSELIHSKWTWVYEGDKQNLYSKPVLEFQKEGVLNNPWTNGTWGAISAPPQIVSVDWSCPKHKPLLSLNMGNAMHVVCMDLKKKHMRSIRVPDAALNAGAMIEEGSP